MGIWERESGPLTPSPAYAWERVGERVFEPTRRDGNGMPRASVGQTLVGTSLAGRWERGGAADAIREVVVQGKHYFSIALGAVLVTGSAAMMMRGPRAADARATGSEQREGAADELKTSAPNAEAPSPR
jgi:hypothetical protein